MKFDFDLSINLVFGRGRVNELGVITSKYGKRALIVTGTNSTKKSGLLARAVSYLNNADVESVIFDEVTQNPLTTTAIQGASIAKEQKCDVVIGIGGGSIMDCAKAIAFLAINEGDINDYIFDRVKSDNALPIILIPTTCGTGSEGNGFAVLTNPENGDKKSLRCKAIYPKVSIIDSECMMTMPKSVLASVGFDALCHNMEAYLSKITQPLVENMALYAIQLLADNLVPIYEGSDDIDAWDAVSLASTIGGIVIGKAGVTLPHGMEHPASGLKNIVHGKGLAALTPVIFQASISSAPEKFAQISRCLGGVNEHDCVEKLKELLDRLDLTINLGDLGLEESDIDWMTENCFKVSAAGIKYHPVEFSKEEIKELYRAAI